MAKPAFEPSSVTKPIQLLSAWLIGLILINASFLGTAVVLERPSWGSAFLLICAALNVPVFLGALFLLQTKFRPEMQEDTFYARYLERRSAETQTTEFVAIGARPAESGEMRLPSPPPPEKISFLSRSDGVWVNDLLKNFQDVMRRLTEQGVVVNETFGSTAKGKAAPTKFIISVGRLVEPQTVSRVFRALGAEMIDGISLVRESYSDDRIYIGSYIYEARPEDVRSLTKAKFEKLANDDLTEGELIELLK